MIPYVIEKSGREERVYDIYSRLLKDRIIFLGSQVNDEVANALVAQMLFLQSDDPKADIHLYINSPGGSVSAGLAIYDTMQFVSCDVATYCIGQAASMGAVLLPPVPRTSDSRLPNARIMIHQPLAGMQGTAEEILIHAKEFKRIKQKLNEILLKHTGQTLANRSRHRSRSLHVSRGRRDLWLDRQSHRIHATHRRTSVRRLRNYRLTPDGLAASGVNGRS